MKKETKLIVKDEAIHSVQALNETISNFGFNEDISEIFKINIHQEVEADYPISIEHVGKSLNGSSHEFMVDIEKKKRSRKVPKNKLLGGLSAFFNDAEMVDEYYMAPVGASSTVDLPYSHLVVRFQSQYPNVNDIGCLILPFVSQTKIIVFSAFYYYKTREWDVKTIDSSSVQWVSFEEFIKKEDDLKMATESLLKELENFSLRPMKSRFELLDTTDSENS